MEELNPNDDEEEESELERKLNEKYQRLYNSDVSPSAKQILDAQLEWLLSLKDFYDMHESYFVAFLEDEGIELSELHYSLRKALTSEDVLNFVSQQMPLLKERMKELSKESNLPLQYIREYVVARLHIDLASPNFYFMRKEARDLNVGYLTARFFSDLSTIRKEDDARLYITLAGIIGVRSGLHYLAYLNNTHSKADLNNEFSEEERRQFKQKKAAAYHQILSQMNFELENILSDIAAYIKEHFII